MEERKAALMLMLCSTLVGFTGNFFLSFIGCMCGAMHYFNNGSAPDLMFMLSFLTSVLGMVYLFSVLSFGTLLFFVSPERVCSVSASLLDKFTGERAALPEGAGYPWNSTELEMHGDHINTYGHHYPKTAKGITQVNQLVCGENGASFILLVGFLVLCFAFCVVTPLISIALRFTKAARQNGGCEECGPMRGGGRMVMLVQGSNGQYHQVVEQYPGEYLPQQGGYPQGGYPQGGGYPQAAGHPQAPAQGQMVRLPTGNVVHTNVPVARAVVAPSSVTVAQATPAVQATVTGSTNPQPASPPPVARAEVASSSAAK